jgi:molybdopterin converting factor subunit 1
MRVSILLFAGLREIVGSDRLEREVPEPATLERVWSALTEEHPGLARYTASVSGAINAEYARMSAPVRDRDEVAFLPPVSGG